MQTLPPFQQMIGAGIGAAIGWFAVSYFFAGARWVSLIGGRWAPFLGAMIGFFLGQIVAQEILIFMGLYEPIIVPAAR